MLNIKKLLSKPIWNYHDIMTYSGFQKSKAYEIMKQCKTNYGGGIKDLNGYVTRDSVLAYLNTTIEREIFIIKELNRRN